MLEIFSKFPEYCESVAGFWLAEPLNAVTNLTFLIGAHFLYRLSKRNGYDMRLGIFLIAVMAMMGLGSIAWHSYRSPVTLILDEIPIYIFIIFTFYYLAQSLTRKHHLTLIILAILGAIYYAVFTFIPSLDILQGSPKYVFALLAYLVLSALVVHKFGRECSFALPLGILVIAIIFRSIDLYICPIFPAGTHFLWHISVAIAMYFASVAILRLNSARNQI